LFRTLF